MFHKQSLESVQFHKKKLCETFLKYYNKKTKKEGLLNKNIEKSIKKSFRQKTTRQKVIWNTIFGFIENGIKNQKRI